jgi:glycosyltransferase involved in cell wall biosynthesis
MALPLVSIVTPSFNQVAFLEATLQSVQAQDYACIEHHVVDGASSDGSVEIIRRHAPHLASWVSEPDSGQAEAINKGFARCTGEIIAWLNSDDLYLPGAISAAVRAFEEHPEAGLVFGDVVSIDGAGDPINVMTFSDWGLEELLRFNIISQPGVFMRRVVLEQAGYLDPSYHFLLDHHLWLRLVRRAPMVYVRERWAAARFHQGAKNVNQAPNFGREADRLVDWIATQQEFKAEWRRLEQKIRAGADRMNGRYLLDGGLARESLRRYLRGLFRHPATILPEWRRIVYAAASRWVNLEKVRSNYLQKRARQLNREDPVRR